MGKILISSNSTWLTNLDSLFKQVGFKSSFGDSAHLVKSYKKLSNDFDNYIRDKNDFVIVTGTMIYKDLFGTEALKKLLTDSYDLTVKELRLNMTGSFCVVIKNGDVIRIFVDETHTYSMYYYNGPDGFLITNTFYHIQKCCNQSLNINAFLERGIRRCIMSNNTPYYNIFKINAQDCLVIDTNNNTLTPHFCELNDYKISFKNINDIISELEFRLKGISKRRSSVFKKYLHFITGGIDSRLELAINMYNNDNVSLAYWTGSNGVTNGTMADLNIGKNIADKFNHHFTHYDVSESLFKSFDNIHSICDKYGEYSSIYAGNSKWFDIFEKQSHYDFYGFGYFGESLRELSELDLDYNDNYTLHDFVKNVYCRSNLEKYVISINGLYEFIEKEFNNIIDCYCDGNKQITKDLCFELFTFSRFDADCIINNYVNMFSYSFPIFSQKIIFDLISQIPYYWKKNDFIPLKMTFDLQPSLISIPFFSHHHQTIVNSKTLSIERSLKDVLSSKLKYYLKKTSLYKLLYSNNTDDIIEPCSLILKNSTVLKDNGLLLHNGNWSGCEKGALATFCGDIIVADNCSKK